MKKKKRNTRPKLDPKRRPVSRFGFRLLHARTARRQRAATAGQVEALEGSVPNVGVARALMIILGLHILAIAGIFVHNRYFDDSGRAAKASDVEEVAPAEAVAEQSARKPRVKPVADHAYVVVAGDTYTKVADQHGVDEQDLRIANLDTVLRPGRILRIPGIDVEEAAAAAENAAPTSTAGNSAKPAAVLVKAPPRPVVVSPARTRAGGSYVVQPGDSVWRLAQRFGVSQETLMEANGIDNPRKLRAGMKLKVPGK